MVRATHSPATSEPFDPIATGRLRLRCVQERDAEALAAMMNESISRRLASWPAKLSSADALSRIRWFRVEAYSRRSAPLVLERQDGTVAGWLAISRDADEPETALVTYWLGDAHRGEGLVREAAPAALTLAQSIGGIRRIKAAVQSDNDPSLAVVRMLGMRFQRRGRIWCAARNREEVCLWFDLDLQRPHRAESDVRGEVAFREARLASGVEVGATQARS